LSEKPDQTGFAGVEFVKATCAVERNPFFPRDTMTNMRDKGIYTRMEQFYALQGTANLTWVYRGGGANPFDWFVLESWR
jgi:hypothetical protein